MTVFQMQACGQSDLAVADGRYDEATHTIILTMTDGSTRSIVMPEPVQDTNTYPTGGVLQGNKLILTLNNGKTVDVDLSGLTPESAGLDCAAIQELPESRWQDGMTVLAQTADGECVRLTSVGSLFTEVGVALSADAVTKATGTAFTVSATVSNSGATSADADLILTLPAGDDYTVSDFTITRSKATNAVRVSDTQYKITGIQPSGNVVVKFKLLSNAVKSYQIGAQVTTDGMDINAKNNVDSISLSTFALTDPNYTPTTDCPHIPAFYKHTDGKEYPLLLWDTNQGGTESRSTRLNFLPVTSLRGVTIRLQGATSVVVDGMKIAPAGYASTTTLNIKAFVGAEDIYYSFGRQTSGSDQFDVTEFNQTYAIQNSLITSAYTFNPATGELTFTDDLNVSMIIMRVGANCNWQAVSLHCKVEPDICEVTTTRIAAPHRTEVNTGVGQVIGGGMEVLTGNTRITRVANEVYPQRVIYAKSGTELNATVTRACGGMQTYRSQGNITLTPNGDTERTATEVQVRVLATATSADVVEFPYLKVVVVD